MLIYFVFISQGVFLSIEYFFMYIHISIFKICFGVY